MNVFRWKDVLKQDLTRPSPNYVPRNVVDTSTVVQSVTIVHHAYAVMVNTTHSDPVAFCLLHKFSSRLTWAVLPWTVVVLSWLNLAPQLKRSELITE